MPAVSYDQAVELWKDRCRKMRTRDVCAKHDIDPRRYYEVLTEQVHKGSRRRAFLELVEQSPSSAPKREPAPHVPRYRRVPLEEQQLVLPLEEPDLPSED